MAYFSNPMEKIDFDIHFGCLYIHVVSINKVKPEKNWYVPEHEHTDIEIHLIPNGKGYINIEGYDFEVHGGEFYITGPMIRHKQLTDNESMMTEYCIELEIEVLENQVKDSSFSYDESVFLKETLSKKYPYAFEDVMGISSTFEEIFKEAELQDVCYLLKIQTLLLKVLIDLLRTVCDHEKVCYPYPATDNSVDSNRIQRIIKYINANFKNHITIEDVSRIVLLSPRQMTRLMEKTFNQTFHEYLLTYRMHMAEKLLMNSSLSIEEVAYESGFSSHFYMYQVFKRKRKITPGQFRSKNLYNTIP